MSNGIERDKILSGVIVSSSNLDLDCSFLKLYFFSFRFSQLFGKMVEKFIKRPPLFLEPTRDYFLLETFFDSDYRCNPTGRNSIGTRTQKNYKTHIM